MEKVVDVIYDIKIRTGSADTTLNNHQKALMGNVDALQKAERGTIQYAEAKKKLDNSIAAATASSSRQVREIGAAAAAQAKATVVTRSVAPAAADAKTAIDRYTASLHKTIEANTNLNGKTQSLQATLAKAGIAFGGLMIIKSVAETAFDAATSFEKSQIAFETMLKSKSKAEKLLRDITQFAEETPFQTDELERAAKSLLAFGVGAKDIVPNLRMIGDISSAIGAPIGEIAELYGKAKVQGRLFAMDINQLTNRGIPIIGALASTMGVATNKVKGLVESGKVGFPELKKAFEFMTQAGGQFEGLTAAMSTSTSGLISTAKDNFEILARTIFQSYQPAIKSALGDTIKFLKSIDPEKIKQVVNVGLQLVKMWIAYKVGVAGANLVTNIATKAQALWSLATGASKVALTLFTKGLQAAKVEMIAFNAASKTNPFGLIAGILAIVLSQLIDFGSLMGGAISSTDQLAGVSLKLADADKLLADNSKAVTEYMGEEIGELNTLFISLRQTTNGSKERQEIIDQINAKYGTTLKNLQDEAAFVNAASAAYDKLKNSIIAAARAEAAKEQIVDISKKIIDLEEELKATKDIGDEIIKQSKIPVGIREAKDGIVVDVNAEVNVISDNAHLQKEIKDKIAALNAALGDKTKIIIDTEVDLPTGTDDGKDKKTKEKPIAGTINALQAEISRLEKEKTDLIQIFEKDGSTFNLDEFIAKVTEIEQRKHTLADLLTNIGGGEIYVPGKQTIIEIQKQVDSLIAALKKVPPGWDRYDELVKQLEGAQATLQKLKDDEFNKDIDLKLDQLNEEERHQIAVLELTKRYKGQKVKNEKDIQARILDIQIEATKRELELMKLKMDANKNLTKEEIFQYEKVQNALEELQLKRNHVYDKDSKVHKTYAEQWKAAELGPKLDAINHVLQAALSAASQIIAANIQQVDYIRGLQQQRVNDARDIAENGNAEMLALEEERLDKLNKKREEFVREQQALSIIELIANSTVAIAKAAAEGGIAAPFTIAATLIALGAGIASAKALASQASFKDGGYTGDGSPYEVSTALGRRPYEYHKGEFVFDAATTHTGNNLSIFRNILKGRMDLEKVMGQRHVLINNSGGMSEAKADELIKAINDKPVPDFHFSEKGIFHANKKSENRINRTRTRQE